MPYIEQEAAYRRYQNWGGTDTVASNFPAPGLGRYASSPNTTNTTARRYSALSCPSDQDNTPIGAITNLNYVVCGGNGQTNGANGPAPLPTGYMQQAGMFDGKNRTRKIKLTDITDGLTNTVMMAEVLQGQGSDLRGFAWWGDAAAFSTYYTPNTKANDLIYTAGYCKSDPLRNLPCGTGGQHFSSRSRHTGGVNVVLGDGSVRFIRESINPITWMNMGPGNDGMIINLE